MKNKLWSLFVFSISVFSLVATAVVGDPLDRKSQTPFRLRNQPQEQSNISNKPLMGIFALNSTPTPSPTPTPNNPNPAPTPNNPNPNPTPDPLNPPSNFNSIPEINSPTPTTIPNPPPMTPDLQPLNPPPTPD